MVGSKDLPPSTTPFFPNVFFKNQFRTQMRMPPKSTNLSGQVAIITGGNTGLGLEAASQLLSYHLDHLILAVRSEERGEEAAKQLCIQHPKTKVEVWMLDMASYDSIMAFVRRVDTELSRLDLVILNAGLNTFQYRTVPSTGHAETIQVNYLSTALLTILLLPILKNKSPPGTPGRLTIVNAALALTATLLEPRDPSSSILAAYDDPKNFNSQDYYNASKLMTHMFLWKLVDFVSADDVVVNLADPAFVKGTTLHRDLPLLGKVFFAIFAALTGRPLSMGASTFLDAALVQGTESHGAFIMSYEIHPFNALLYTPAGEEMIDRLWEETLGELGFANVGEVLESMKS